MSVTYLNFFGPSHISGMAEARVVKFCIDLRLSYVKS